MEGTNASENQMNRRETLKNAGKLAATAIPTGATVVAAGFGIKEIGSIFWRGVRRLRNIKNPPAAQAASQQPAAQTETTTPEFASMNPYQDMKELSGSPAEGKFITNLQNGLYNVSNVPDRYVYVKYFQAPPGLSAGHGGNMTIRRFPMQSGPLAEKGMFMTDPKSIDPNGIFLIPISGEDYGYESARVRDVNGKILGETHTVSPWYFFAKEIEQNGIKRPVAVDPRTQQPILKGEPPFVVSRYMFGQAQVIQVPKQPTPPPGPQK